MNSFCRMCLHALIVSLLMMTTLAAQSVVTRRGVPISIVPSLRDGRGGGPAASAATDVGAAPAVPFTTVRGYTVGPVVTPTTTAPEAEEEIAVDPTNFSNLVAVISDFSQNTGFNMTKYAVSTDNGTSWAESFVPRNSSNYPTTGDGANWTFMADPTAAIDNLGNYFISSVYANEDANGNITSNGVYVGVARTGGGANLTAATVYPVMTNLSSTTTNNEDKPWVAVDNSGSGTNGSVYLAWTHFVGSTTNMIYVSHSLNHGQTWSAPVQVSTSAQNGAVQGAQIAIGAQGQVYVVYDVTVNSTKNTHQHFLAKSTDGGNTFSASAAITGIFTGPTFVSNYRKWSWPALAVDPLTGNVYEVFTQQRSTGVTSIMFIASTNGGATFSSAKSIVNTSVGQHFMPALAVDGSGAIHASWFDTRNSASNPEFVDVYATYSSNAGGTFFPNNRVTPSSIDTGTVKTFIGDYTGNAAANCYAHPVWTSGGYNNGHLQTAKLTKSGCS